MEALQEHLPESQPALVLEYEGLVALLNQSWHSMHKFVQETNDVAICIILNTDNAHGTAQCIAEDCGIV